MIGGPGLWRIAWRNLWRNRRRTLLTLASIAFGIFLAILFTSLQDQGFADMIDTAARMGGGHVTVQHPEYQDTPTLTRTVRDGAGIRALAEQDPDVERVVERISGQAMIATARNSYGAFFVAYDPAAETDDTLSFLEGVVDDGGTLLDSSQGNGIVLGKKLAKNLGVGLGDKVVYTMVDRSGEIVAGLGRVKGQIGTGSEAVDAGLVLLPIDTVRSTLGYDAHEATQIALFLNDSRRASSVAGRLEPRLGGTSTALPWFEVAPELSGFIAMKVGGARFMEGVILVLVAASIFNTLFVSVLERTREFGILMAIGYSPWQIFGLVMWESLWLAVTGVVAGALITIGPYKKLAADGIDLSGMTADQSMEVAGVGMGTHLPVGIYPENVAIIITAVVAATLVAGLYPAWRAGRVEPVEAIKLV